MEATTASTDRVATLRATHALLDPDFPALLHSAGKFKERSASTHDNVHASILSSTTSSEPITCLLLGQSMIERFRTTGRNTAFNTTPFPKVFNAGVGGDQIANVVFRLGTKGLFSALKQRGVGFVILDIGTNDLHPKRGLNAQAFEGLALVLEAVVRLVPKGLVLVDEVHYRADIKDAVVDEVNAELRALVADFNKMLGETKVYCVDVNSEIPMEHLEDHVHYNERGYQLFSELLLKKMGELGLEL